MLGGLWEGRWVIPPHEQQTATAYDMATQCVQVVILHVRGHPVPGSARPRGCPHLPGSPRRRQTRTLPHVRIPRYVPNCFGCRTPCKFWSRPQSTITQRGAASAGLRLQGAHPRQQQQMACCCRDAVDHVHMYPEQAPTAIMRIRTARTTARPKGWTVVQAVLAAAAPQPLFAPRPTRAQHNEHALNGC